MPVLPLASSIGPNQAGLLGLLQRQFFAGPGRRLGGLWVLDGFDLEDKSTNLNAISYTGGYTAGVAGTLARNNARAVTPNGSTGYGIVGTLGGFGSGLGAGATFAARFRTASANSGMALMGSLTSGMQGGIQVLINRDAAGGATRGDIRVIFRDQADKSILAVVSTGNPGVTDGLPHDIFISVTPSTNTVVVYIDGVAQSVNHVTTDTPATFANLVRPIFIGASNGNAGTPSNFFTGTLEYAMLLNAVLPVLTAKQIALVARNAA